jgi:hypothetical protein
MVSNLRKISYVLLDPQDSLVCPPFKRNFRFGIGEMALTAEVEALGKNSSS